MSGSLYSQKTKRLKQVAYSFYKAGTDTISYYWGDIFASTTSAIANSVNTEEIMGKGLALQ